MPAAIIIAILVLIVLKLSENSESYHRMLEREKEGKSFEKLNNGR